MRAAILGATSHIAKNLIFHFCLKNEYELFLFARNEKAVIDFLQTINKEKRIEVLNFNKFPYFEYDVVINCVGIGDPQRLKKVGGELFFITEYYDNLVLNYLTSHEQTIYINFSSGAVYGTAFEYNVTEESIASIAVNKIGNADYYRIAKLNSEAKHRSLTNLHIIDLRVFSFFSRFINLEANFLICDMIRCLKERRIFYTNNIDIVRDYVAPSDLFSLVELCIDRNKKNLVLDVYSAKPIRKSELINMFSNKFGLEVQYDQTAIISATGLKQTYYSSNESSKNILKYSPKLTSYDSIYEELKALI